MLNAKKTITLTLVFLLVLLAFASSINFAKATLYSYTFQGPLFMNGLAASSNTVSCSLLWSNNSYSTITLTSTGGGVGVQTLYSPVTLQQMTWNSSTALNYTSLIAFNGYSPNGGTQYVNLYIPDPTIPFALYTFVVTDFAGMTHAYLKMTINNQTLTGGGSMAEQADLSAAGTPTFVMTSYYTYTLTFVCDQGTYSQSFTAENLYSNSLIVLAGAFPSANITVPTADAARLNSTLIGITYQDPSNLTNWFDLSITHQSGTLIINDYSLNTTGSTQTVLWNAANSGQSYTVNITSLINGTPYIWNLAVPSSASSNPWLGAWDWLGSSVPTMPYVTTGWPIGMTTNQIAEIVGGIIIAFFLTIGSFRSSGATCILAWVMSGFLIALGWWGNGTIGGVSAIPEFALSGFIAIMIHLSESKDTVREV